jgi:endonuclease/exonuclease/phosphatase family metal-dependent hydrolase
MRLLQLNIWQGRFSRQILELIDQQKPDLLCLQEAFSSQDPVATPERMFNSFEMILQQTGYAHSYFSPTFSSLYSDVKASFGNAIISRYPLLNTRTVFTNGEYVPHYNPATYNINIRNLQLACVRLENDREFMIANHHAHWNIDPLGDEISVAKMKLVKAELQKTSLPTIFSGDLNVTAASKSMRVFDGFLDDLTATHKVTSTLSSVGKVTNVACDHILINSGINVKAFQVRDELVSDHKALILDFEV